MFLQAPRGQVGQASEEHQQSVVCSLAQAGHRGPLQQQPMITTKYLERWKQICYGPGKLIRMVLIT
jgi:hypothetical protein